MKYCSLFVLLFTFHLALAQENPVKEENLTIDKFTDGTLTLPENSEKEEVLVIFIQGSGPVNRDGNAPMAKNDGVKKIAHELAKDGIATFRFDKRILKMDKLRIKEEDLKFEDFVTDVNSIVTYFRNEGRFEKIILAGHSEGSLIGILSSGQSDVDAYISLAGAGRPIDEIIVEQIAKQSGELSENAQVAFEEMKKTGGTINYSPFLESIFRKSVQPYMHSWMKFNPAEELSKLKIPVLVLNGSFDIQVDVKDAEILHEAATDSKIAILEDMNHIFRKIEGEHLENTKAYNEPQRPLHPELIPTFLEFVKSI